jgi:hypothetical protein
MNDWLPPFILIISALALLSLGLSLLLKKIKSEESLGDEEAWNGMDGVEYDSKRPGYKTSGSRASLIQQDRQARLAKLKSAVEAAPDWSRQTLLKNAPAVAPMCPVCSAYLDHGERVKSTVFPTSKGDKIMHIKGCVYCLSAKRSRVCPVCLVTLNPGEVLIARVFEKPGRKTHIHVLGCTHCRGGFF